MSKALAIACITVLAVPASAIAQQAGIKRTVIRTFDYPPGYTTITGIVELERVATRLNHLGFPNQAGSDSSCLPAKEAGGHGIISFGRSSQARRRRC